MKFSTTQMTCFLAGIFMLKMDCQGSHFTADFYVLTNGTDSPECGRTRTKACASFPRVLSIFHNKYNTTDLPRLKIITDMAITIDRQLMMTYDWLSGLSLWVEKVDAHFGNASLNLHSVTMVNSFHKASHIDVSIVNGNLTNYRLKFNGRHQKEERFLQNPWLSNHLAVTNSIFSSDCNGQTELTLRSGQASFSDVQISEINQTGSIIEATTGSIMQFKKCRFLGNSVSAANSAVVVLKEAKASITDCVFEENRNMKDGGAIHATKNSELNITRSRFSGNSAYYSGGAIFAKDKVTVDIIDSEFRSNNAFHTAGVISSSQNTTFRIENSIFTSNSVNLYNGGCIDMSNNTNLYIVKSTFDRNVAGTEGGVINSHDNNKLIVKDSEFVNNLARVNTGVLSVSCHCDVLLENNTFVNNTATLTLSVISANHRVTMVIAKCLFDNNPSAFTGLLEVDDECMIKIKKSTFTRNSADVGSLIEVGGKSAFDVHDTIFVENTGGSLIYGHDFAGLLFQRCIFANHSLAADPIMVISNAYVELNNSTFFNNSQHKEGGIVIGKSSCIVNVTSSKFVANRASKGAAFYISRESKLLVDNCTFINNSAGDGGVLYILDSKAFFKNSKISNSSGTGYGGVTKALNSKITIENSNFTQNEAFFGGCFYLETNSSLAAYRTVFKYGQAREGGAIYKNGPGNISLEDCILGFNSGEFGGAIFASDFNYLRLAKGMCQYDPYLKRDCLTMQCSNSSKYACDLYTYNYTINNGNFSLNSKKNHHFFEMAKTHGMIFTQKKGKSWLETPFASLEPIQCGKGCRCYYIQDKGNIFNCSASQRKTLPSASDVPNVTNWLDVSKNKLNQLCGNHRYFKSIAAFFVEKNNISYICNDTVEALTKGEIKILNLTGNKLRQLPKYIRNVTSLTHIWLSGNPFVCNCDMLWMKNWMESFNKSGERVVQDFFKINCEGGFPVHALDAVRMGCFPMKLAVKLAIGLSCAITVVIVIAIIAISKRWNEVKWFMYLHFDILDKNDGIEDVKNMEKDALISYSVEDDLTMREIFMKEDGNTVILEEDHGMQLVLHERDFTPGVQITANIEEAVTRTRRMVMLLSRKYVTSNYCLQEFQLAHHRMIEGDKKYLIAVLLEPLNVNTLPRDLQMYLRTYTYIDSTKHPWDLCRLRKRIRFAMPRVPLSKLKNQRPQNEALNESFQADGECGRAGQGCVPGERRALLHGHAGGPFGTAYASVNHC